VIGLVFFAFAKYGVVRVFRKKDYWSRKANLVFLSLIISKKLSPPSFLKEKSV